MPTGNLHILESPFLIYGLVALAAGLFIFGIGFLLRSYRDSKEHQLAVPISDIKEIKSLKQTYEAIEREALVTKDKNLANHLVEQSLSAPMPPSSPETLQHEIKLLKAQLLEQEKESLKTIEQLSKDNQKMQEALRRELGSKDKSAILDEDNQQTKELQDKLKAAQDSLSVLTEENHQLLKKSEAQQALVLKIEETFRHLKETHEQFIAQKNTELGIYKDQFKNAEQQAREYAKLSAELKLKKEEADLFRESLEQKDKAVNDLKLRIKQIEQEQAAKIRPQEETITMLQKELAGAKAAVNREVEVQLQQIKTQLLEANAQYQQLSSAKEQLQSDYNQLKEFNQHVVDKEKLLHYELTKYRAQVLGLEKICEDFKVQIDVLHR